MILLPYKTNVKPQKTPYVNIGLIILNVIIFVISFHPHVTNFGNEELRDIFSKFMLYPESPRLFQFISYAFLHGGYSHIIGNMLFLYIFGNNVNDKLGHIGYLCFYIAGAIVAGIGHSLFSASPVLGASGAVAAVTGAYLVIFPQTLIYVFYWLFFFIGSFEAPALFFILFKMIILDNIIAQYGGSHVAYDAHLSGYAFGIAATMLLYSLGLIKKSGLDLYTMTQQWNRRRSYKNLVSENNDPFKGIPSKTIQVKQHDISPQEIEKRRLIMEIKKNISDRAAESNMPDAAALYLKLIEVDNEQILSKQLQLDVANQLMSQNQWKQSAEAYQKFLEHFPKFQHIEQVNLMLGILYSRYLNQNEKAMTYLTLAANGLKDEGQKRMCSDELQKLRKQQH